MIDNKQMIIDEFECTQPNKFNTILWFELLGDVTIKYFGGIRFAIHFSFIWILQWNAKNFFFPSFSFSSFFIFTEELNLINFTIFAMHFCGIGKIFLRKMCSSYTNNQKLQLTKFR